MKKIVGNWKCNLDLIDVVDYFDFINMYSYDHTKLHIGLAVPTVWLFLAKSSTSNFRIYAQDVDYVPYGSYTSKLSYKHLLNIETNQTILNVTTEGKGTVLLNNQELTGGDVLVKTGEEVRVKVNPAEGYKVDKVEVNGIVLTKDNAASAVESLAKNGYFDYTFWGDQANSIKITFSAG